VSYAFFSAFFCSFIQSATSWSLLRHFSRFNSQPNIPHSPFPQCLGSVNVIERKGVLGGRGVCVCYKGLRAWTAMQHVGNKVWPQIESYGRRLPASQRGRKYRHHETLDLFGGNVRQRGWKLKLWLHAHRLHTWAG